MTFPTLRERAKELGNEWPQSITKTCTILAFFFGLAFLVDPLYNTIGSGGSWSMWGRVGLTIIGVVLVVSSTIGLLYPETGCAIVTTFILCGFGLVGAFLSFTITGMIFWVLAGVGAIAEMRNRIRRTGRL